LRRAAIESSRAARAGLDPCSVHEPGR